MSACAGLVRQFPAERPEALELLDGTAEQAFRLGLITEEEREGVGLAEEAVEAFGHAVVAILGLGDLDVLDQFQVQHDERSAIGVEGLVEAGGIDAAFDAGAEKERLLGEGDAFEGEEFLGIDGPVAGDEVGAQVIDGIDLLDANDGEIGAVEAVLAVDGGLRGGCFGGGRRLFRHRSWVA